MTDLSTIQQLAEANIRIASTTPFTLLIDPRDIFTAKIVQSLMDPEYLDPNYNILIDYVHQDYDECIAGSDYSRLKLFCRHWSHSHDDCRRSKICRWIPNELTADKTFVSYGIDSC